jgi:putative transposase
VRDLFSNLVVGWSMHHRQDRHMVVRAVQMAVWQRSGSAEIILHSDRGGQLKRERVNHRQYRTRDEARADLFDYLERFHNPRMRRRVARKDRRLSALTQPSVEMG